MRDCLHLEGWDMKIVVISDIQSNLAAISALPEESYEQLWCLGDIVGYGPRLCGPMGEISGRFLW